MYNGVGLATPRGSGTSGHVQRNCAALFKKEKSKHKDESKAEPLSRQPNKEILEHTRKREIELKCLELSDALEEQGYTQDEIDAKVESYRKMLLDNFEKSNKDKKQLDEYGRPITKDTHQTAEAQIERNAKLRDAFGLDPKIKDEESQSDPKEAEEEPVEIPKDAGEEPAKKSKDSEEKLSKKSKNSEERSSKKSKDSKEKSSKKSKDSDDLHHAILDSQVYDRVWHFL
ncbi:hypothetical protein QAD02_010975 [Eretmocerus hayati]|uniref:Uncharacterized protein n=1 Tax=Eretmocerus hayati TaxID=131215 RepID=A0ACC2NVA6_9HYME|nr:hypothetical protein QAD02_010975 [Eretmocerus hayati]